MAFQYWQQCGGEDARRTRFVTLRGAYHGDTLGAVSVGGIDLFHSLYRPLLFDAVQAETGDAADMERALSEHAGEVAAVIVEPLVQGAAGMRVHPHGYLRELRELCDRVEAAAATVADQTAVDLELDAVRATSDLELARLRSQSLHAQQEASATLAAAEQQATTAQARGDALAGELVGSGAGGACRVEDAEPGIFVALVSPEDGESAALEVGSQVFHGERRQAGEDVRSSVVRVVLADQFVDELELRGCVEDWVLAALDIEFDEADPSVVAHACGLLDC